MPPVLIDEEDEEPIVAVGTEIIPENWIKGSEQNPIELDALDEDVKTDEVHFPEEVDEEEE